MVYEFKNTPVQNGLGTVSIMMSIWQQQQALEPSSTIFISKNMHSVHEIRHFEGGPIKDANKRQHQTMHPNADTS